MRNMRILIDTNILLDYLLDREPFAETARHILALCETKKVHGCIAAHSVINIFYILRGKFSVAQRKEVLYTLCKAMFVVDIESSKIFAALENQSFNDIEDYLQAKCAASYHADYILSRNCKDFAGSTIPAIEPDEFLALFGQTD